MATVGEILKEERLEKGLTLNEIEKKLKVREKFIKAIEDNNWSYFSSKIYIIGILRNYSRLLNLDSKRVLAFFRRDYEKKETVKFKEKISSSYLISESKKFFRWAVLLGLIFFLFYFGYQLKMYFSPPGFEISSPVEANFTTEVKVKITGKTDKDAILTIANQRVYLNRDGSFQYDFPLKEGENRIVFDITGANGRKTIVEKKFYKKSPK